MRRTAVIQWGISSFFGWGVYGLNLALHWAYDPDIRPVCAMPIREDAIHIDPLRRRQLDEFVRASAELTGGIQRFDGPQIGLDRPVLTALGNDFRTPSFDRQGRTISGRPTIGVVFFETARLTSDSVARASAFPVIVTGSTWNERVLAAHGVTSVRTVLQGIDPTLFHPAPRSGLHGEQFLVFSGGKLELRKGQDLVLRAFARFAKRHPEARLVTAWHSPWPALARTLEQAPGLAAALPLDAEGKVDSVAWAQAHGIDSERIVDLGAVPNAHMPPILREMDVALFPNRCEGGTNLVAMECMACGVPCILSANTGHLDIAHPDLVVRLEHQGAWDGPAGPIDGVPGWGESDVDEIVQALERAHAERAMMRAMGARAAAWMQGLTWRRTAQEMKQIVTSAI